MAQKKKPTPSRGKKHLTPMQAATRAHARRKRITGGPKLANEPGPVQITDPPIDPASLFGGVM
jgi:hypothetical protein